MDNTTTKTEIDTNPSVKILGDKRCFILYFRRGNKKPESKVFLIAGDLPKAIQRARDHCEKKHYRYCGCYPFIVDLDIQERTGIDEYSDESI